jgi:hypothetical protein
MAMTIEQISEFHKARPFRPFTIRMADGRSFRIPEPEYLSHPPSGRTVIVFDENDSFHILDSVMITHVVVEDEEYVDW